MEPQINIKTDAIFRLSNNESDNNESNNNDSKRCAKCYFGLAQYGCDTCEVSLCDGCWFSIHTIGTLKTHDQIPIDQFINISKKCKLHPHYNLDLVCTCKNCSNMFEPICILCEKSKHHKGHTTELLDKVVSDKKTSLNTKLKNINNDHDIVVKSINECCDNVKTINNIKNSQINKVNEIVDDLQAILDTIRRKSITSINKIVNHEINSINSHKNKLNELLKELINKQYSIENILKINNELSFMIEFAKNSNMDADEFVCGAEYEFNEKSLTKQINDIDFEKNICYSFTDNCKVIKQLFVEQVGEILKLKEENDILQSEWNDSIAENDILNHKFTEELNNEFMTYKKEINDLKDKLNNVVGKNYRLHKQFLNIKRENDMLKEKYSKYNKYSDKVVEKN